MSSSTKTPHSLSDFSRFHVILLLPLPHFRFSHLVNRTRTPHQPPNRQPHTAHTASTPHFQSDSAISVQPHKPQTAFHRFRPTETHVTQHYLFVRHLEHGTTAAIRYTFRKLLQLLQQASAICYLATWAFCKIFYPPPHLIRNMDPRIREPNI